MSTVERVLGVAMWSGVVELGELRVPVWADGRGEPWGGASRLRVASTACASGEPTALAGTVLAAVAGADREYRVAAAALAADDTLAIVELAHGAEVRLRSLGEALVIEWGWAESAEQARGFVEADIAVALARVRALPRRLPLGARRSAPSANGTTGQVIDIAAARRGGRMRARR